MDAAVADTCTTLEPTSAVMGVSSTSGHRAYLIANVATRDTTQRPMDAAVADTCTTLEPTSAVMGVSSAGGPRVHPIADVAT